MATGTYQIAIQHGKAAYYAKVVLEADWDKADDGVVVEYKAPCGEWQAGVQFGIEYAYEHTSKAQRPLRGLSIRMLEFHGHAVDTTNVVAAFASMNALWNALGVRPVREPSFEKDSGIFTFPK